MHCVAVSAIVGWSSIQRTVAAIHGKRGELGWLDLSSLCCSSGRDRRRPTQQRKKSPLIAADGAARGRNWGSGDTILQVNGTSAAEDVAS